MSKPFTVLLFAGALLWLPAGSTVARDAAATGVERELPAAVQRVLTGHELGTDGLSLWVQPVDAQAPVLAVNPERPRNPASTIKLLTTLVALELLGPAYSWATEVYVEGTLASGVLEGDLILRGRGDPFLTTERMWTLVRELRARGLSDIRGDLVIDNSYFALEPEDPGAFDGQPHRAYNAAPDALLVNFKAVRFRFLVDSVSHSVSVLPDPVLANLEIDNRIRPSKGYCGGYQRGIRFDMIEDHARPKVVFSGRFPLACGEYSMWRSVMSPPEFAYGAFRAAWEALGGELHGGMRVGVVPEPVAPFYIHRSPPLAQIIRSVNKHSNNVMTRHLLLTLGAELNEPPGTEAKGRDVLEAWLQAEGLQTPELRLVNGAGLARETRISAESLARVLLRGHASPFMPEFISSMPLAGMDGTFRRRFRDEPHAGQMHIKTGRLDHVSALAGYVLARSGRTYVVVALHNAEDVHRGPGQELEDALLRWIFEH